MGMLDGLLGGIVGAWTIPMANDSVHEKAPISRQQRAIFQAATGRERRIGSVGRIQNIETEQPKVARQLPEMPAATNFVTRRCCNPSPGFAGEPTTP